MELPLESRLQIYEYVFRNALRRRNGSHIALYASSVYGPTEIIRLLLEIVRSQQEDAL